MVYYKYFVFSISPLNSCCCQIITNCCHCRLNVFNTKSLNCYQYNHQREKNVMSNVFFQRNLDVGFKRWWYCDVTCKVFFKWFFQFQVVFSHNTYSKIRFYMWQFLKQVIFGCFKYVWMLYGSITVFESHSVKSCDITRTSFFNTFSIITVTTVYLR